ncbi:MAG: glycosyltransferase family 2 protein [Alistipes sp.]|jgi:glycosyltransferase involved in cell wall biosynthesis|nr:glycosyltransferase family 2 protein [Alistipes sp.]
MIDLSIVVPLYNEEESLRELAAWVGRVCREAGLSYELIFVDDGSTDGSWATVEDIAAEINTAKATGAAELAASNSAVRAIKFSHNYGKAAALYAGFEAARGEVVVTMDADLQDSPDEIPELRRMIIQEGYDLVSGWKRERHDPAAKRLPSKFYNATVRLVSGIRLHDMNCGLKAYRRAVVKSIEVYGEMHRYIPILARQAGFRRIGEKVVEHRARKYGQSKYGIERMVKGYLDLITVSFMSRFGRRPMYLFGGLGTLMFLAGGVTAVWLIVEKLVKQSQGLPIRGVADQPMFYIALVTLMLGVMLFLTGFLAELINRNAPDRNRYSREKEI